jgi:hypothetical protein
VIVFSEAAVVAILGTKIGEFHDSPQVDFIPHEFLADSICGRKKDFRLLLLAGGQEEKKVLPGRSFPIFARLKDFQESWTNHSTKDLKSGGMQFAGLGGPCQE